MIEDANSKAIGRPSQEASRRCGLARRRAGASQIVLSPMLVESGQPLLISNLDLSDIVGESEDEAMDFFHVFPQARSSFRLGTAVRMSATFPIVSPAIQRQPNRRFGSSMLAITTTTG
jgi:hypothetical protein